MPLLDRCIFTAASAGSGDFVVSAAVLGYRTPAQSGAVDGVDYSYSSQTIDRTQWEEGDGIWTASTNTWARTNVTGSSNNGAKVNYSSAPLVMATARAKDIAPPLPTLPVGAAVADVDISYWAQCGRQPGSVRDMDLHQSEDRRGLQPAHCSHCQRELLRFHNRK